MDRKGGWCALVGSRTSQVPLGLTNDRPVGLPDESASGSFESFVCRMGPQDG